jgi:16S rRNA processing protein RimM
LTDDSPGLDPATAVSVGRIVASHALKGEVKVQPLTDFPERFDRGSQLWLDGSPRTVQSGRWQGGLVYLKLEGIDSRNDADALRDKELMVPEPEELEEGVFYLHDIMGISAFDAQGEPLGKLVDVLSTGANDVYVIRGERGELLVPATDEVVQEIDIANGRLVVEMVPGLEFQAPARPKVRRPARKAD